MALLEHTRPSSPPRPTPTARAAGALVVVAAAASLTAYLWAGSTAPVHGPPRDEGRVALGEADGAVPDRTTVFDDAVPAVARLDPALLSALRRAAADAGEPFVVDSGWRSREYQERLLHQAIAKYGSAASAARWVAPPTTSAHVAGEAVDLGPDARTWLSRHGARYGLCQIYRNEPWHYELRPRAADEGCPRMYADAAHDPRMR